MNNILIVLALILIGCHSSESNKAKDSAATSSEAARESDATLNEAKENISNSFTSEPSKIVKSFFEWYADVINKAETHEYQAKFIADKEGMLTLDYTNHIANLERLQFSKQLIKQEIEYYRNCINKIKSIKYAEKESFLANIEDYQKIGCDFFNSYRWINSMDTFDGIKIIEEEIKGNSAEVKVQLFNYNTDKKEYYFWDKILSIKLEKNNNRWEIVSF